jgi:hypothetical protein
MRRIITLALAGAVSLGGVAAADEHRDHRGHVERHENHGTYRGHDYHAYNHYSGPRYEHRGSYYYYGYHPYYGHRYFNHYRRPALIVENYAPRPGFIWISGQWYWDGREWLWQPGYYAPTGYAY